MSLKNFEKILRKTQEELFKSIAVKNDAVSSEGAYVYIQGNAPILLIAHLDTVHSESVQVICKSDNGNIWMSPQGIGGDDRCGVYALIKIHAECSIKPHLLFTCDEEIGGIGAKYFTLDYLAGAFKELLRIKLIIEIDRKGKNDAVYYDCSNAKFEEYISSKGFKTAQGVFSDISIIAPALGVAAVNLSSGYYNPHTPHEYINIRHLFNTIAKVKAIVEESPNLPQFKYEIAEKYAHFNSIVPRGLKNIYYDDEFDITDY